MQATRLRCEYLTDPVGVGEQAPRLSWERETPTPGEVQSGYRIQVSSSEPERDDHRADLWDSGLVASSRSTHVAYGGAPLRSRQRCWWRVQLTDGGGAPGPWSSPARWEMGLLGGADWTAAWIGAGTARTVVDPAPVPNPRGLPPSPLLRKAFRIDGSVVRARAHVTALGVCEVRINGRAVDDALLTPGWTDYGCRVHYRSVDVTACVSAGDNVIGAVLGDGWYSGTVAWMPRGLYGPEPLLRVQLEVELDDGRTETIGTDGSWRATAGPVLWSDLMHGETFDARRAMPGWDTPGFDDAAWTPVVVTDPGQRTLVAHAHPPVRRLDVIAALAVDEPAPDTHVFDLGQNIVGWVRLRVDAPPGTTVRLRHAEMLQPDGHVYVENLRSAEATDRYVTAGTGVETWEPRFTTHGFRYVEVTGLPSPLPLDTVTGVVVGSDTETAGTFACSDELVNQLHRNIVWGQRGNFLEVPTDCPQRDERQGWLGDAQVFAPTAVRNADVAAFFTKWLRDVEDAQDPSGCFPDIAPFPHGIGPRTGAPAWADAGIIVPWVLYETYGDTAVLERHYEAMCRYVAYVHERNPDLLWVNGRSNDYGDWLAHDAPTPKDVLATMFFARSADLLSRIASVLGRDDDASRYRGLFESIRAAFVAAYVGPDGFVAGGTQTGHVLALRFDLLPAERRSGAVRHLVADIEARGGHLSTGFHAVGHLLPALTEAGEIELAYRLLLNDTFPSWGYSIRHGATTIWERWDGWTDTDGFQTPHMNSFNHYSLGSVGEWLHTTVGGLDRDPEVPGWSRALIRPRPGGGITWATSTYHSIHGQWAASWRIADGRFELDVTVPAGCTAAVWLPGAESAVEIGGGDHHFTCPQA